MGAEQETNGIPLEPGDDMVVADGRFGHPL